MDYMHKCMIIKGAGMVSETKISFGKMLKFEINFCFKTCPFLMWGEILASIIHGISFVCVMYVTQLFFDVVANAVEGNKSFQEVALWALLLGGTVILNQVINGFENWLYGVLYEKLKGYSILNLYKKAYKVGAEEYESPDFLDYLRKARDGSEQFIFPLFPIIAVSTFYLAYFLGIGWYIFNIYPVLAFSILIIFIPSFLGEYIKSRLFAKLADEAVIYKRKFEYFEQCICGKEYFKETTLLTAAGYFKKHYLNALKDLTDKEWKTNKKSAAILIFVRMLTLVGYLFILLMFVDALIKGRITVGVFAAIYASIGKMFEMMDEVVDNLNSLVENVGVVQNYIRFLELPEEKRENREVSISQELQLKDVTFRYKKAEKDTLSKINLTIHAGDTVAIVGENGSGKSTLVKVLSGLYPPKSGQVLYDGVDISQVERNKIYDNISIVGQNFIKYMLNVRNNINISKDFSGAETADNNSDQKMTDLLAQVDVSMEQKEFVQDKLDTMLGREFEGIDLSGGQWQRIAIARGMYRPHQMIVLDEPTAAIDPIEENKIFQMFSEMSTGSTSIIVTHRMGCAKIANLILVMEDGEIVEAGTHEKLMEMQGKYFEMYQSQQQWYQ